MKKILPILLLIAFLISLLTVQIASADPTQNVKVKAVRLNRFSVSIKIGQSFQLKPIIKPSDATNKKVSWVSGNPAVASVSSTGKVSAKKTGVANITVKTADGSFKATCKFTVYNKGSIIYKKGDEKSKGTKEAFANFNSPDIGTTWFIWVNQKTFKVNVFKKKNSKYELLKTYACCVGKPSTPTRTGKFKILFRKPVMYSGNVSAKYAVRFTPDSIGHYYFHSYLYNTAGTKVVDATMSKAASHGCVRMLPKEVKYIYDKCPNGTVVFIN